MIFVNESMNYLDVLSKDNKKKREKKNRDFMKKQSECKKNL